MLALMLAVGLLVMVAFRVTGSGLQKSKPGIDFTVSPGSIHLGGSAELSWTITGSDRGFLSYVGTVTSTGSVEIRPEQTTTYTLLADAGSGLIAKRVTVEVVGGKRGDEFPTNPESFKYPITATTRVGFADLAAYVHSVLQEEMHLSVRKEEYDADHSRLVFVTTRVIDHNLLKPSETRIGARRVAYLVAIEPGVQLQTLDYTVKTLVEYRLRIEETWRSEQSEDLYTSSGISLSNRIENKLRK